MYTENPKTKGSGILCAIPQKGTCPNNCKDCFFQSGRSYLEPLDENLPNLPPDDLSWERVIRINDGNDSLNDINTVVESTINYKHKFYNTARKGIEKLPGPVVLTINPGPFTDVGFHKLEVIPDNLMFVRFRANMWNIDILDDAVKWYSERDRPIVLTFMAYHDIQDIPSEYRLHYIYRQRTSNPYYAITSQAWRSVMDKYWQNKWVYSCGRLEGEMGDTHCRFCGNCIREYFVTMERMHPFSEK